MVNAGKKVDTAQRRCDVCIVGAGAAGIIMALELSRLSPSMKILLIEFGSKDKCTFGGNSLDDSIEIENLVNHHPSSECTNKGLGGTTNTWGGRCVMYDRVDFLPRKMIGDTCTWDEGFFDECLSYVPQTQRYFDCSGPFEYPLSKGPIAQGFESQILSDRALELWSLPTRFGERYRNQLESCSNVEMLFNARLDTLRELPTGNCQLEVEQDCGALEKSKIEASKVILCNGAFEATRTLLKNQHLFESIGGPPNALGKFYQGHVSGKIATVRFHGDPKQTEYGFGRRDDGSYIRRRFQFTTAAIVQYNLLNTAIWLDNPLYFDPEHHSGAMSFMYLAMITPVLGRKLAPPAIIHSVTKGKKYKLGQHLWNILKDFPGSLITPFTTFVKRYCRRRKLPGIFLYSASNSYALHFHAEQVPLEENRFELSEDGSKLIVHYAISDVDVASVIHAHELLDRELRASGCGQLEYWFSKEDLPKEIRKMSRDGVHQCGTTRIADSPRRGVVDRNLQVFGTKSVYVCSSSCFPTSGQANPTFFMGVTAVRLAHQLSATFNAAS